MHFTIPALQGYFGGKGSSGVHQQIINIIPPHSTFVVPFLGHCSITRHIKPADHLILLEKDPKVFKAWRDYFIDFSAGWDLEDQSKLIAVGALHKYSKRRNLGTLEMYNTCAISFIENFPSFASEILIQRELLNRKYFFYLDPPYVHSTRKSAHRYSFDMTDAQHIQLLEAILKLKHPVAISNYANPIYDKYLKNWNTITFKSKDRQHNMREETVYFNYDLPTELHDYSYMGNDYRKREDYKRKAIRMVKKWERMTPLQQNFYKQALIDGGVIS